MDIVEMSIADEFLYDRNKETDAKCFIRYKTDKKNWTIIYHASTNE